MELEYSEKVQKELKEILDYFNNVIQGYLKENNFSTEHCLSIYTSIAIGIVTESIFTFFDKKVIENNLNNILARFLVALEDSLKFGLKESENEVDKVRR
jgi:hypothetical protein